MKRQTELCIAALLALTVTLNAFTCSACAKEDPGDGYYGSLKHPDFGNGVEKDSGYQAGDGYYGYLDKQPAAAAAPANASTEQAALGQSPTEAATTSSASPSSDATAHPPVTAVQSSATSEPSSTQAPTDKFAAIEQKLFEETYARDSDADRLNRIEKLVFGKPRTGSPDARIAAVRQAINMAPALEAKPDTAVTAIKVAPLSIDGLLKRGENDFNQQAYHAAQDEFEQAVQRDPYNQNAHYWLGMTRMHLTDYEGAKDELQLAFRLNPFSPLGMQAKSQLLSVSETIEKVQRPAVDPPSVVRQTMRIMAYQAASLQAQKWADANATAAFRRHLGYIEANRIGQEMQDWLRGGYGYGYGHGRFGRYYRYGIDPGTYREVSNAAMIRSNYVISDSHVQAANAMRDGTDRMYGIQSSMNGALGLMGSQPRPGEPRLRAFGTNLYVHYYGNESVGGPPVVPPDDPPLKAVEETYKKPQAH